MKINRRGSMLVEMIVVVAVMATIAIPCSTLFRAAVYEVPRNLRITSSNSGVNIIVTVIQKDYRLAIKSSVQPDIDGLPGDLDIDLANGQCVRYRFEKDKVIRLMAKPGASESDAIVREYYVADLYINWSLLRCHDKVWALELQTAINYKQGEEIKKAYSNSYCFFPEVCQL